MFEYRSPLTVWLKEIQNSIEVESLNALQAKSVATTPESFKALLIRESQITIQEIRLTSTKLIDNLDHIIDQIPIIHNDLKLLKNHYLNINQELYAIIMICQRKQSQSTPKKKHLIETVLKESELIIKLINSYLLKKNIHNSQLESTLRKLKENFGELMNHTIKTECQVITRSLYKRTGLLSLKWSLLAYCCLAQNDAYMCRIFIQFHNIIKPLIEIVNNYSSDSMRAQQQIKAIALRVITILCINGEEAVKQLMNECIYNQFLTTLILNETSDLVLKESIDLLVQLTKHFIDYNSHMVCHLDHSSQLVITDFVYCLTKVLKTTKNPKIFLLTCAAIANISFVDIDSLIKNQILEVLINGSNGSVDTMDTISFDDIFLRDQVITIVANISRKYPLEIVSSGGLVFILDSLRLKTEDFKKSEDLFALERIQQKVLVAIARLANNESVTQVFLRLNVIQRLIQLCKVPIERNFSDSVLIACVAALKRLDKTVHKITID